MTSPLAKRQKTSSSLRHLLKDVVSVHVGIEPNHEIFHIHKELVCRKSNFFSSMLRNGLEQAQTSVVHVTSQDPDIFALFQHWLYTSELHLETILAAETVEEKYELAVNIVAFGFEIEAYAFHDKGIDLLLEISKDTVPGGWHVFHAYEKSDEGDPLRLALQQITASNLKSDNMPDRFFASLDTYPEGFIKEVFKI